MVKVRGYILFWGILLLLFGCTGDKQLASQSLILSLKQADSTLTVINYEVRNTPFMKSQQQGRYQAHLLAEGGRILQEINFEKMDLSTGDDQHKKGDFFVSLPLMPKAERVKIYQLDGRSGHYQLKADDPLLDWSIPQDIR